MNTALIDSEPVNLLSRILGDISGSFYKKEKQQISYKRQELEQVQNNIEAIMNECVV